MLPNAPQLDPQKLKDNSGKKNKSQKQLPGGSMKKKLKVKNPKITYKTSSRVKKTFNVPEIDHHALWDFHYKNPIPFITDY